MPESAILLPTIVASLVVSIIIVIVGLHIGLDRPRLGIAVGLVVSTFAIASVLLTDRQS